MVFEQGGELLNIVPAQVFDCHAGGAREPERVDQALHAPLVDPVIDGLARHPTNGRCRTWPACQPDRRCNEIRLADSVLLTVVRRSCFLTLAHLGAGRAGCKLERREGAARRAERG